MSSSRLDAIIINWNNPADTIACARNLAQWQQLRPRIWIVDNASQDESIAQIRAACPEAHLICSPQNLGFTGGTNLALRRVLEANSQTILFINNDAFLDETNAQILIEALESDPTLGFAGPLLYTKDGRRLLSAGGLDIAEHVNTHISTLPPDNSLLEVTYISGTVAVIKAGVFRQVGLLDDKYFFGGEMADICARARQANWRSVTAPGAIAYHDIERSSHFRTTLHTYYILRNRFLFIHKFHRHKKWPLYLYWTFFSLKVAVAALAEGKGLRARAAALALWDGLTGTFGGQNERVYPKVV